MQKFESKTELPSNITFIYYGAQRKRSSLYRVVGSGFHTTGTRSMGDANVWRHGADIIKIEPVKGDWVHHYAYANRYLGIESFSFVSFNRNKRSIPQNLIDQKVKQ